MNTKYNHLAKDHDRDRHIFGNMNAMKKLHYILRNSLLFLTKPLNNLLIKTYYMQNNVFPYILHCSLTVLVITFGLYFK